MQARLYVDKYRGILPIEDSLKDKLDRLSEQDDFPHIILQGARGSGKKTRALYFLQKKIKQEVVFKKKDMELKLLTKTIELHYLHYNNSYFLIDLSLFGVYDRIIIQDFIKDILNYKTLIAKYKIIILDNADKLTFDAQQSLRRTLEKYMSMCRFIFLVNGESSIIEPLLSRCLKLRVPSPSNEEIKRLLEIVISGENLSISPDDFSLIAGKSNRNFTKALNYLNLYAIKGTIEDNEEFTYIQKIVDLLYDSNLRSFRNYLYDLLVYNIDPINFFKGVMFLLLDKVNDDDVIYKIIQLTEYYENTFRLGAKPIYHAEAYLMHLRDVIK
jgi:replication factor C subunit 3/5